MRPAFEIRTRLIISVVASLVAIRDVSGQDSLSQLRDDVRAARNDDDSDDDEPRRHDRAKRGGRHDGIYCGHGDNDDAFAALVGQGIFYAVTSPFWGPPTMLGDNYETPGYFADYPYKDDFVGYMMIEPSITAEPSRWSLRTRAEYADDFDQHQRIGGHVLWEGVSRFGIDTAFDHREEIAGMLHDELWTGDFNIVFRFAQREDVQLRSGVGVNWLADSTRADLGFNFTYGGDWYPVRPLVVSAEIDWGWLGNADIFHGRTTVGVVHHGVEVYAGYDYYDVGSTQIDGFVSGLRVWF